MGLPWVFHGFFNGFSWVYRGFFLVLLYLASSNESPLGFCSFSSRQLESADTRAEAALDESRNSLELGFLLLSGREERQNSILPKSFRFSGGLQQCTSRKQAARCLRLT